MTARILSAGQRPSEKAAAGPRLRDPATECSRCVPGLWKGILGHAAVGLYGVLAYSVSQRTREIGVRMALGADSRRVQGMVLRQVGAMVGIGATVGALGALGVGRAARSLLYGLDGHDPLVFATAVTLLVAVAFGAGWVPARRASRTQPMRALRYD